MGNRVYHIDMVYKKIYQSFEGYVNQETYFNEDQKYNILESFQDERNKKIFRLSLILLIWSILGAFVDIALVGGGIVATAMKGIDWRYFLPEVIYFIVNFIAKVWFVRWYMNKDISSKHAFYCGIPYAGSALILAFLLKDNPLFLKSLRRYLIYLRKRGIGNFCKLVKNNK